MASVNKVFLLGNLTRDVEVRHTPSGAAVAELGVACNRRFRTRDGEDREEVTFVDVTVWNAQAEACGRFLAKGQPVHVEGYLKLESWQDKATGEKRSKLKVEAERVQFLGGRRDEPEGGQAVPVRGRQPAAPPPPRRTEPVPDDGEDSIPF